MADYSNYDKKELLKVIEKQEKELKTKKYGLVWDSEREPEQVVLDCENNLPILKRIKSKEIRTDDSKDNILIEGDNYHALTVLNYTHKEQIDVIYIDPPYNTGAKDWKYNNNYVDKNDAWRHSKWINMMEKRLKIAKSLLKDDGVILVAIDDHEVHNIRHLLNKIMNEKNYIATLCCEINPAGQNIRDNSPAISHDYCLIYAKSIDKASLLLRNLTSDELASFNEVDENGVRFTWDNLRRRGGNSTPKDRPGQWFPLYVHPSSLEISITKFDGANEMWPIDPKGIKRIWRVNPGGFEREYLLGNIAVRKIANRMEIQKKSFEPIGRKPKTLWKDSKYSATTHGTKLLHNILGRNSFTYPKSLFLTMDCIRYWMKKDGLLLDFFAGSGTTGHAVLELNKEDGGNRNFILCTNNENNICEEATYPRVKNVIKGYDFKGKDKTILFEKKLTWTDLSKNSEIILDNINDILAENKDKYDKIENEFKNNSIKINGIKNVDGKKDGLNGNLQYFKTALIKKSKNRDQVKLNLTKKCTEMLCVKENIFNLTKEDTDYKIFSSNKADRYLCVYYNLVDDTFDAFIAEIKKLKGKKKIYMFSMENEVDKSLFADVKNKKIEPIPQNILDVYKQLVKMNIPIKPNVIFTDLNKAKNKIFTDKDKDDGARVLRIVLEKIIQKIAQNNSINILNTKGKEEKITVLNDKFYNNGIINKVEYVENRTYLTIGNNAAHGEYNDYDLKQIEKFYKHIQSLLNSYNI